MYKECQGGPRRRCLPLNVVMGALEAAYGGRY